MAKKKTLVVPLKRCRFCATNVIEPCRRYRQAQPCLYFKRFEHDFYQRVGGGPVAMTSATRGRKAQ